MKSNPQDKLRLDRLDASRRETVEADLKTLPEVPTYATLSALVNVAMNTHIKGVDLWNIGKHLQMKHHQIPFKTEYEVAAGLWHIVRKEILEQREAAE